MAEHKIKDLKRGMKDIDITVEVDFLGNSNRHHQGYGQDYVYQQAMVKDDTGEIKMTFWDDDAKKVKEGSKVRIQGGYVSVFRDELQLNADKEKGVRFI